MSDIENNSMEGFMTRIKEMSEGMSSQEKLKFLRELNVLVKNLDADVVELKQQIGEEKQAEDLLAKIAE